MDALEDSESDNDEYYDELSSSSSDEVWLYSCMCDRIKMLLLVMKLDTRTIAHVNQGILCLVFVPAQFEGWLRRKPPNLSF